MKHAPQRRDRLVGNRRGTSLIEVVVMIGVATAMLGLAVTTIHLLLRAERQATRSLWHNRAVVRLSRALRDDVHAARSAVIEQAADDEPLSLKLTLSDDRQIAYDVVEHEITRVETVGGAKRRRESFYLPPGSTIELEREAGPPETVRLVIDRAPLAGRQQADSKPSPGITPMRRRLVIEATLGRDHRFAGMK